MPLSQHAFLFSPLSDLFQLRRFPDNNILGPGCSSSNPLPSSSELRIEESPPPSNSNGSSPFRRPSTGMMQQHHSRQNLFQSPMRSSFQSRNQSPMLSGGAPILGYQQQLPGRGGFLISCFVVCLSISSAIIVQISISANRDRSCHLYYLYCLC